MKKEKLNKILLRLIILLVIGCIIYISCFSLKRDKNHYKKQVDSIEEYDYKLYDNASSAYKKLFYELKDILNSSSVSEEEYVKVISKMFVMDFYTLDNKTSNNDIGGRDFVYDEVLTNFEAKALDTVYAYLETKSIDKKRLPRVEEVSVDRVDTVKYMYLDTYDDACYTVHVSIRYEKDLGYDTEKTLYFVHDENKLSLVEIA